MIGGVLLAAGAGSRFRAAGGDIKLLAPVAVMRFERPGTKSITGLPSGVKS